MSEKNPLLELSVERFVRTAASSQRKKIAARQVVEAYGPVLEHINDVVFIL